MKDIFIPPIAQSVTDLVPLEKNFQEEVQQMPAYLSAPAEPAIL